MRGSVMEDKISILHFKLFPEEYHFTQDSISDPHDRRRGINPMSLEYQDEVNLRRLEMGVEPFLVEKRQKFPDSPPIESNRKKNPALITSFEYCSRQILVKS
jgi:hypothetical protein